MDITTQYVLFGISALVCGLGTEAGKIDPRLAATNRQLILGPLQDDAFPRPYPWLTPDYWGYSKPDTEVGPKCIPVKAQHEMNVYSAMKGYDPVQANPFSQGADPGVKARIFLHDCFAGYYDFVTDVTNDLQCDSDFSMKSISSMESYETERGSSSEKSQSAAASGTGTYYGVTATASVSFGLATNEDEQAAKSVLTKYQGEILIAKATCLTHVVSIAEYVRPVFTRDFINGLTSLHVAATNGGDDEKKSAVRAFVQEFGSTFSKTTNMGAQLIYERRFANTATDETTEQARSGCVKSEARASVGAAGYGNSFDAKYEQGSDTCNNVNEESSFSSQESIEGVRIVSRGSRPRTLSEWIENDFKPVPITRSLVEITSLFKDEWLTKSEKYGFDTNLSGSAMKAMFETTIKDYCPLMLEGVLDKDCNIIGCQNIDCQHGGTCVMYKGAAKCNCPAQYSGDRCQVTPSQNACKDVICRNGGTCENGKCKCKSPYTGDHCNKWAGSLTKYADRSCDTSSGDKFTKITDAEDSCKLDVTCLYVFDNHCDNDEWQLCSKSTALHTSSTGSCIYGRPFFQFKKDQNGHGDTVCHVPLADMRMSKDDMKKTYGCSNDAAESMRVCHAKKGTKITIFDKDDMNEDSGSHLDITVKADLNNNCGIVSSFNDVGTTSDNYFYYDRRKQGNGHLNDKISSFVIKMP